MSSIVHEEAISTDSSSNSDSDSVIFIYDQPIDIGETRPYSPTSSVKGCYVRSRPTSAIYSESGSEIAYNSATDEGNLRPAATSLDAWAAAEATQLWAQSQNPAKLQSYHDDGTRSLFTPSTFTSRSRGTIVPMRIVRREEVLSTYVAPDSETGSKPEEKGSSVRRRTWPSVQGIRKTMSSIFTRKDAAASVRNLTSEATPEQRRVTVSGANNKPPRNIIQRALSSRSSSKAKNSAQVSRARKVRRSASFAGFTSVLAAIEDDVEGDEFDEATAEARDVVELIRRRWEFQEVEVGPTVAETSWQGSAVFERAVE